MPWLSSRFHTTLQKHCEQNRLNDQCHVEAPSTIQRHGSKQCFPRCVNTTMLPVFTMMGAARRDLNYPEDKREVYSRASQKIFCYNWLVSGENVKKRKARCIIPSAKANQGQETCWTCFQTTHFRFFSSLLGLIFRNFLLSLRSPACLSSFNSIGLSLELQVKNLNS